MKKQAIIVGNGTTRKNYDLNTLPDVSTFLCGIAHREMNLTTLAGHKIYHVTVEEYRKDMLLEDGISESDILFPVDSVDHVEDPRYHNRFTNIPRNNSGMFAMKKAIQYGNTELSILGFDSLIQNDAKQSISNMFEGKPETRARAEDNPNRIRYLDWFCLHNMFVNFYFVFDKEYEFYDVNANNIHVISYERFMKNVV